MYIVLHHLHSKYLHVHCTCICKLYIIIYIYNTCTSPVTCTCITDFHSIYEKLIQLCNINEFGTNYPKVSSGLWCDGFDPYVSYALHTICTYLMKLKGGVAHLIN